MFTGTYEAGEYMVNAFETGIIRFARPVVPTRCLLNVVVSAGNNFYGRPAATKPPSDATFAPLPLVAENVLWRSFADTKCCASP